MSSRYHIPTNFTEPYHLQNGGYWNQHLTCFVCLLYVYFLHVEDMFTTNFKDISEHRNGGIVDGRTDSLTDRTALFRTFFVLI